MGATDEYLEQAREHFRAEAEKNTRELILWPDLEDAFRLFRFAKWTYVGTMGGAFATGIPSSEIDSISKMLGIKTSEDLLEDIRIMEAAAIPIINAKKST